MLTVKYKQWDVEVAFDMYMNGNTAINLVDVEDGGLVATATVNTSAPTFDSDLVGIKDYSENEGMVDFLVKEGIIEEDSVHSVKMGFVSIPFHTLTEKAIVEKEKQMEIYQ